MASNVGAVATRYALDDDESARILNDPMFREKTLMALEALRELEIVRNQTAARQFRIGHLGKEIEGIEALAGANVGDIGKVRDALSRALSGKARSILDRINDDV